MIAAVLGGSGNMGREAVKAILYLPFVSQVRLLAHHSNGFDFKGLDSDCRKKACFISGSITDKKILFDLVNKADVVLNMAAVIPPLSDKKPALAEEVNYKGLINLIDVLRSLPSRPLYIHISTVALYGNRNAIHPFGRVGDPLLVSAFDAYGASKLRGELAVIESGLNWVVLRQTGILYPEIMKNNLNDGLMFHTPFNTPLEWVTSKDTARLIAGILAKREEKKLTSSFYRHVFNIGGGEKMRDTGYEVLKSGFSLMGGKVSDFFSTRSNVTRNFHGIWFYDSCVLEDEFHFQRQSGDDFWKEMAKKKWFYAFGRIVPDRFIKSVILKKAFNDSLCPSYWEKKNDQARLTAFYGSKEAYENINSDWNEFPLFCLDKMPDGSRTDYKLRKKEENAQLTDLGYDYAKKDEDIDYQDLVSVALAHGGKVLSQSFKKGDLYSKVEFENQDGEAFFLTPYAVLRAGHWINPLYKSNVWDFDRLARKDRIYAALYYDSHSKVEDNLYYLDSDFVPHVKKAASGL